VGRPDEDSLMVCPNCNARASRSRPRTLRERLMKAFSGYKIYSCRACGWRALCAPVKTLESGVTHQALLGWIMAAVVAAAIVVYVINDFYTKSGAPPAAQQKR
jgi:hypothetical protein